MIGSIPLPAPQMRPGCVQFSPNSDVLQNWNVRVMKARSTLPCSSAVERSLLGSGSLSLCPFDGSCSIARVYGAIFPPDWSTTPTVFRSNALERKSIKTKLKALPSGNETLFVTGWKKWSCKFLVLSLSLQRLQFFGHFQGWRSSDVDLDFRFP